MEFKNDAEAEAAVQALRAYGWTVKVFQPADVTSLIENLVEPDQGGTLAVAYSDAEREALRKTLEEHASDIIETARKGLEECHDTDWAALADAISEETNLILEKRL